MSRFLYGHNLSSSQTFASLICLDPHLDHPFPQFLSESLGWDALMVSSTTLQTEICSGCLFCLPYTCNSTRDVLLSHLHLFRKSLGILVNVLYTIVNPKLNLASKHNLIPWHLPFWLADSNTHPPGSFSRTRMTPLSSLPLDFCPQGKRSQPTVHEPL